MRDDVEFNIKFCELVEKYPSIYDHTRSDYCNRNVQDKVWQEIGKELKESGADCKQRWQNIRGRYSKFKKAQSLPSGSGAKSTKEYYLAPYLHFLDRFIKSRKPKSNLQRNDSDTESDHSCYSINATPSPLASDLSSPSETAKKQKMTLNDVNKAAYEYFSQRKIQVKPISTENMLDSDLSFLHSVLPDMKLMTPNQKRAFKIGILNLSEKNLRENLPQSQQPITYLPPQQRPQCTQAQYTEPTSDQAQTHPFYIPPPQQQRPQCTQAQYTEPTSDQAQTHQFDIPPYSAINPATPRPPLNTTTTTALEEFNNYQPLYFFLLSKA